MQIDNPAKQPDNSRIKNDISKSSFCTDNNDKSEQKVNNSKKIDQPINCIQIVQ